MICDEIKCHVNTSLGLVGGHASPASPLVSAPGAGHSSCWAVFAVGLLDDILLSYKSQDSRLLLFIPLMVILLWD